MTTDMTNESLDTTTAEIPKAVFFWAAMLLVLAGLLAFWVARKYMASPPPGNQPVLESPEIPAGEWVSSFTLNERNGKEVGSEDLKGSVWVANFFYSTCPGSCRQQTMLVSGLEKDLRDKDVRFVSITCDPKHDTPEVLREYAHDFNAPNDWWFLTGDLLYIRRVGAEFFRLAVSEKGHQDRLAVVDKWGNVRGRYNWHDELQMEKLKELVDELVVESEPPKELEDGQPAAGNSSENDANDANDAKDAKGGTKSDEPEDVGSREGDTSDATTSETTAS